MVEQYLLWVLIVGVAIGAAATWFAIGRLPRRSDDISEAELVAEAELISSMIEARGGVAPASLVEEVLELHLEYVGGMPIEPRPADPAPDHLGEPAAPGSPRQPQVRNPPPASDQDRPHHAAR